MMVVWLVQSNAQFTLALVSATMSLSTSFGLMGGHPELVISLCFSRASARDAPGLLVRRRRQPVKNMLESHFQN